MLLALFDRRGLRRGLRVLLVMLHCLLLVLLLLAWLHTRVQHSPATALPLLAACRRPLDAHLHHCTPFHHL